MVMTKQDFIAMAKKGLLSEELNEAVRKGVDDDIRVADLYMELAALAAIDRFGGDFVDTHVELICAFAQTAALVGIADQLKRLRSDHDPERDEQ